MVRVSEGNLSPWLQHRIGPNTPIGRENNASSLLIGATRHVIELSRSGRRDECYLAGISLGQSVASQNTTVPSGVSKHADVRLGVSPPRRILRRAASLLYVPSAWNLFRVVGWPSCRAKSQSAKETLASCHSKHLTSMSVSNLLQERSWASRLTMECVSGCIKRPRAILFFSWAK